ncbi:hypothetical protein [Hyphomicrobium sp.]|uniref:hypothetical protein n=1 Tax=Hyphomicrobium sp. TaxID=82 RepID=UPI0025BF888A|nr:hypothetical protein [Hyphomicrobium sp.]MCC7253357.1 peptidoglycan-binding protein [Hyphomicrobium sp.]
MRFVLEAFRQLLAARSSVSLATVFAAGGVALAAVVVVYGALLGSDDIPEDAVTVTGPVFTPVAATPPAPTPAERPSGMEAYPQERFDDRISVARAVQIELKRAGCYSGPINGIWSASTRAAMGEFTARVNARLPIDRADPVLLALLETHNKISCTADCSVGGEDEGCVSRPPVQRSEVASIERQRPAEARAERLPAPNLAETPNGADDLGFNTEDQRAPNPINSVQTASTERDDGMGMEDAAALTAAGVAAHEVRKHKPRRSARKYRKKNSFPRAVSRGFRQIQRSLNKLF